MQLKRILFRGSVTATVTLCLAGCTGTGTGTGKQPTTTATVTVQPTSTPTLTSTPTSGTTKVTTTTTSAPPSDADAGCPATGGSIPVGAQVQKTNDVDLDSRVDEEFITGTEFGVKTASGAIITVRMPLAGGGDRHGWISVMEAQPPVAVVDDGHTAAVFAFVNFKFVTPTGTNGKPYTFTLWGFGKYGSGVSCIGSDRGGYNLAGVNAVELPNGRYRIDTTAVDIPKSGTTAKNGQFVKGTKTFAGSSQTVVNAKRSFCNLVPLIDSGGK